MPDPPTRKPPRVILASFPHEYRLPGKPSRGNPQALDAHRETGFLLSDDLDLFEQAMNLQLAIVAANAKVRGPKASAMFTLWSRAFTHLADAVTLMSQGSYGSSPALVRVALDAIAVQRSLIADNFAEYEAWFEHAVSQDREHAALQIDIGHYKAASVLVSDERLGTLYRLLMDLSLPHLGSSLLLTAPESSLQKIAPSFADASFHLGWAQLTTGWLLLLAGEQLTAALNSTILVIDGTIRAENDTLIHQINQTLDNKQRCYVEHNANRWIFHNFRRGPAGQPKRIVLGHP